MLSFTYSVICNLLDEVHVVVFMAWRMLLRIFFFFFKKKEKKINAILSKNCLLMIYYNPM